MSCFIGGLAIGAVVAGFAVGLYQENRIEDLNAKVNLFAAISKELYLIVGEANDQLKLHGYEIVTEAKHE